MNKQPFSWKNVRPGDPEWELKLKLERDLGGLRLAFLIGVPVVFALALLIERLGR